MTTETAETTETREAAPADPSAIRHFPCDGCGAKLEFHIGQQNLKCPYCGFEKPLTFEDNEKVEERCLEEALKKEAGRREESSIALGELELSCKGCSATVSFSGQLATAECPFCGLAVQRDDAHVAEHRIPVDGVLPFQIERAQATTKLREWVSSRWFAPGEFKKRGAQGRFNGLYLPHWTFDAMTHSSYTGERGTDTQVVTGSGKNRRVVTHTSWQRVSGGVQHFFDDVLTPASKSSQQNLIQQLAPWPLESAAPFKPDFIAGSQAMAYDIELEAGYSSAKQIIASRIQDLIRADIGGDRQRVEHVNTNYSALTYKHVLLPVWMLAYRYNEQSYQVVVNACTGEVTGERPWSVWKILGAVTLALLVLLAFLAMRN